MPDIAPATLERTIDKMVADGLAKRVVKNGQRGVEITEEGREYLRRIERPS